MVIHPGTIVIKRDDPLERRMQVMGTYSWLGHRKVDAVDERGEWHHDYEWEFRIVEEA